MKNVLFKILFLITISTYSQTLYVECEQANTIYKDEVRCLDLISFGCASILLVEDNSVLYIHNIEGVGSIIRSGLAGVRYNENGLDRLDGDANPTVVLIGDYRKFENLTINENIDIIEIYE